MAYLVQKSCYFTCRSQENINQDSSPKYYNSFIIYSPSCHSKPVRLTFFCGTQKKVFWEMFFFFCSVKNVLYGQLKHSSKPFLCSAKEIVLQVWNDTRVRNDDRIFRFWWAIHLTHTKYRNCKNVCMLNYSNLAFFWMFALYNIALVTLNGLCHVYKPKKMVEVL